MFDWITDEKNTFLLINNLFHTDGKDNTNIDIYLGLF